MPAGGLGGRYHSSEHGGSETLTSLALALVLVSALFHATWNTATKGSDRPTAFLLAMEGVLVLLFSPVLFLFDWSEVPTATWTMLAVSAVAHAFYALWLTRAYTYGDLSLVYPIARSTPALVPLAAVPLFGEAVSIAGAGGIALVLAGMWAVQTDGRLKWSALRSRAARFGYLTLLATVAYSLTDKRGMVAFSAADWAGPAPRALVYLVLLEIAYVPLFAAMALRREGIAPVLQLLRTRLGLVVGGSVCGVVSYGLILEAFRASPVSYVVAVRQTSVLFAVGLGVILLRERPGRVRVLGSLAIVAGVALIALSA